MNQGLVDGTLDHGRIMDALVTKWPLSETGKKHDRVDVRERVVAGSEHGAIDRERGRVNAADSMVQSGLFGDM